MRTNIVIPMKAPAKAKTRLAGFLSDEKRHQLAIDLFRETLKFFNRHFSQHPILVVTESSFIAGIAKGYGASVLIEEQTGLRHAAECAAKWSIKHDFQSQLLIPADIAQLDVQEITELLSVSRANQSVVISPATDDGTNALITTPPNVIPFLYGTNSSLAHQRVALMKAIECTVVNLPKLALDIDTPDDIKQTPVLNKSYEVDESLLCSMA